MAIVARPLWIDPVYLFSSSARGILRAPSKQGFFLTGRRMEIEYL